MKHRQTEQTRSRDMKLQPLTLKMKKKRTLPIDVICNPHPAGAMDMPGQNSGVLFILEYNDIVSTKVMLSRLFILFD